MITMTEKEKTIVNQLNHPLYTVEFLEAWINRDDNPFTNAFAALQAMGAKGYYEAVRQMASADVHQDEAHQLREYKEEQERKRREGLIVDLPAHIGDPVFKISCHMMRARIDTVPFSLEDFPQVGKTVFALTQEGEAKEALEMARERMNEAEQRRKESVCVEDEYRRKMYGKRTR